MGAKAIREFDINIVRLDNKTYNYDFELSRPFFAAIPDSLIEDGKGKAFLILDKSETMIQLQFTIELVTELICDVSLEKFEHTIKTNKRIIIKFGQEDAELSEDVMVIASNTQELNVASFIYEFICLEIPMKKVHPKLRESDRPDLVYSSESEESNTEEIDPRWAALKNLKEQK